ASPEKSAAFEIMELLIDRGADVNVKANNGTTPLMLAAFYDDKKCVELLIDHGADINAKNNLGLTARMFALLRFYSLEYKSTPDSLEIMSLLKDSDTRLTSNIALLILPSEIELYQVVGGKDKLYENIENIKAHQGWILGHIAIFQPGEYQLKATYHKETSHRDTPVIEYGEKMEFPFQAKDGCLYALKYQSDGYNWTCWIEELLVGDVSVI
ncbi:MAG TPA: ankyrin repeat domain-containing protein, partial [Desulfatiglandales bacterium]|nr:ankyrin repeat domain-containing protein [Desulfatiglandales bacterium]